MTQAEASDLRSLIERVKETAVGQRNAVLAHEDASRVLQNYIHFLEYPAKQSTIDSATPKG